MKCEWGQAIKFYTKSYCVFINPHTVFTLLTLNDVIYINYGTHPNNSPNLWLTFEKYKPVYPDSGINY